MICLSCSSASIMKWLSIAHMEFGLVLGAKFMGKMNINLVSRYPHTLYSKYMAQAWKGRLLKGPYKPIHQNCAMYFSIHVFPCFFFPTKDLSSHVYGRGRGDHCPYQTCLQVGWKWVTRQWQNRSQWGHDTPGIIKLSTFLGIKQCKSMVYLRDFPFNSAVFGLVS